MRRIAVALLLSAVVGSAQEAAGAIEGVVTDSVTKQPLAGAQVSLVAESPAPDVFTDNAGGFRFTGLEADRYRLFVRHPGYRDLRRNVELTDAAPSAQVKIKLTPLSEISGQVLDDNGRPFADVLLYIDSAHRATTDAEGRYRIAGLAPGEYRLSCRLTFAMRAKAIERDEKTGEVRGYADTYYFPGVEDYARAIPATVAGGTGIGGFDFRLRRVPLVEFSGRVVDRITGEPLGKASIELLNGGAQDESRKPRTADAEGRFRFDLIPPGHYTLGVFREAAAKDSMPPVRPLAILPPRPFRLPVEIGQGSLTGIELRIPRNVDLVVNVTAPHPERTQGRFLVTMSRPGERADIFALPSGCSFGSSCVLREVPPGDWTFDVQPSMWLTESGDPPRRIYFESVRFGTQSAWKAPVTVVEAGNPAIEIGLTDQAGNIAAAISTEEARPLNTTVVVARRVDGNQPQREVRGFGPNVLVPWLLPGDYQVAAFIMRDDDELRVTSPDRCGGRAVKVTVTAGATAPVTLLPCVPD